MKRKGIAKICGLGLAAVMGMGLMVGCGSGSNASATTSSSAASESSAEKSETTVTGSASGATWSWGDDNWAQAVSDVVSGETLSIGFTGPAASEFYDIIMHGCYTAMNEIHDRFGVNFEFDYVAPASHDQVEAQVATIEDWVTKGFDAILVCTAGDYDSMQAVYKKAEEAGTAIYLYNMPTELWDEENIEATSCITYNNGMQAGYIVGQYAAEKLNGEGNILFISGNDGHWTTARKAGFEKAIAEYPGLKIVGEQRGEYVLDAGMKAAENLLQANNGDVDFIYGENEEMAQGAVQAVEAMGLKLWDGTDGIIVVGADGLTSGYDLIEDGALTGTMNVGAVDMGIQSIRSIFLHEMLGYSIDKIQYVPTTLVDSTNVAVNRAYNEWVLAQGENYK